MIEVTLAIGTICGVLGLVVVALAVIIYQEIKNMTQQKPLNESSRTGTEPTTIAIETIGAHKVLLLSNGHVQVLTSQHRDLYMTPSEATSLYDFLLRNMAFIERRRDQNKSGN